MHLDSEVLRLKKIINVLMDRVEKSNFTPDSAFNSFENNVSLTKQVEERTKDLEETTQRFKLQKSKLESIVKSLPGTVIFFDKNENVSNFYSRDKYFLNNIPIDSLYKLLGDIVYKQTMSEINKLIKKRLSTFEIEVELENDFVFFECSLSKVESEYFLLYIINSTEKYKNEILIKEQQAKILNSSKLASLGEMAGGIAHEINNPLAIISLLTARLRKSLAKNETSFEHCNMLIDQIEDTTFRISKIIKTMRTVSRESIDTEIKKFLISEVLEDILFISSEKFSHNEIKLLIDFPENITNLTIMCDQVQLSQVLINLLNNSFDAVFGSDKPHWVKLSYWPSQNSHHFEVSNSGPRISESIVDKIFNPFFTTKDVGKGTGIGLSISKSIINNLGGRLYLDMTKKNTTFHIELNN